MNTTRFSIWAAMLTLLLGLALVPHRAAAQITFGVPIPYLMADSPQRIAVGDLNNDGRPDLVTAYYYADDIGIRYGQADGSFGAEVLLSSLGLPADKLGYSPIAIAVAKLGTRTSADIIILYEISLDEDIFRGVVRVVQNNGNGTFGANPLSYPTTTDGFPIAMTMGDINGDSRLDILVIDEDENFVRQIRRRTGNTNGTFSSATNFAVADITPRALIAANVTETGGANRAEIITVNEENTLTVLRFGTNFVRIGDYAVGVEPVAAAVTDVNGDGKMDVVTANASEDTVSVLIGNSSGQFPTHTEIPVGYSPIAVLARDMNADGFADVVTANYDGTISTLQGHGNGTFEEHRDMEVGFSSIDLVAVNLNGDNLPDLLLADDLDNIVYCLLNTSPFLLLSGTVVLEDAVNSAQQMQFDFQSETSAAHFVRTITLRADGTFTIPSLPPDLYEVKVKGSKWLCVLTEVDLTANNVTDFEVLLPAGDATGDNAVDIADLLLLIQHYNTRAGNANFLEACDLNCDGSVNIADLLLLIGNYNQIGD